LPVSVVLLYRGTMASRRLRRLLHRFVRQLLRPTLAFALLAGGTSACTSPMTPAAKLNEAVQDTNMALRFGRKDVAMDRVAIIARAAFMKNHRLWGSELQIVDVEFGGLEKMTEKEAVVLVGFSWFRPKEGLLRATVVRQTWKNDDGTGPWHLVAEERASGDLGLLGDTVVVVTPEKKDKHFETKVIPER
jgi:hypothetical protein